MLDVRNGRNGLTGFDRMLVAVAATFLAVAASGAQAQTAGRSVNDLAIDAAVPRPEPADVPPPTANDFKLDAATAAAAPVIATPAPATTASTAPAAPAEPAKKEEAAAPAAALHLPLLRPQQLPPRLRRPRRRLRLRTPRRLRPQPPTSLPLKSCAT